MPPPSRNSCVLPYTCIPHRARARTRVLACCVPQVRDDGTARRAAQTGRRAVHAGRLGEWIVRYIAPFRFSPPASTRLGSGAAGPAPFPRARRPPLCSPAPSPRPGRADRRSGGASPLFPSRVRGRCRVYRAPRAPWSRRDQSRLAGIIRSVAHRTPDGTSRFPPPGPSALRGCRRVVAFRGVPPDAVR